MAPPPRTLALLLLAAACTGPDAGDRPFPTVQLGSRSDSTLVHHEGLHRLYVVNPELPTVSVLDDTSLALVDELDLGGRPARLALAPDGTVLYATDRQDDRLVAVDLASGAKRSASTGSDPVGVITDDNGRVYVASFASNTVDRYDPDSLDRDRSWKLGFGQDLAPIDEAGPPSRGWDPRGLSYDAVRKYLVVSHHFVNRISLVDVDSEAVLDAIFGDDSLDDDVTRSQGIPYGFGSMAMGHDIAAVPHFLWNPTRAVQADHTVWPAVSLVGLDDFEWAGRLERGAGLDIAADSGDRNISGSDIAGSDSGDLAGMATPIAAAFSPDDALLYVLCEGSEELVVIDVDASEAIGAVHLPGHAPRGLQLSDDGDTAWVDLALSGAVLRLDLRDAAAGTVRVVSTGATLSTDPQADLHAAEALFYGARSPASANEAVACGTCHPDGMGKSSRWFIVDEQTDHAVDARSGHRSLQAAFTDLDPVAARADLVRFFQDQGGMVDVDPDAPPDDVAGPLTTLEAWLHGPGQLPFHGSWASSPDGSVLDPDDFVADSVCGECHPTVYAQYQGSAHAHAALDEPFYLPLEAEALEQAGDGMVTWCLGCHDPAALLTGSTHSAEGPLPEEQRHGITCLACHGIQGNRTAEGNNAYVLDPALALADGFPGEGEDATAHAAAMHNDGQSSFCAPCHQAFTPGAGVKEFFTYREYLQSPFHAPEHEDERRCEDCHMPQRDGVADHHFASPSLSFAQTWGTQEQVDDNIALLQSAATVEVKLVGQPIPGEPATLRVTVDNTGAGHRLPTGVGNLRQLWLEITGSVDGELLLASGLLDADGRLPSDAVRFGKRIYDEAGDELVSHHVWRLVSVDDTTIDPGGRATADYTLDLPADATQLDVSARLRYRSLNTDFLEHVQGPDADPLDIVDMASDALHRDL